MEDNVFIKIMAWMGRDTILPEEKIMFAMIFVFVGLAVIIWRDH